jgi:hypothetical protein
MPFIFKINIKKCKSRNISVQNVVTQKPPPHTLAVEVLY